MRIARHHPRTDIAEISLMLASQAQAVAQYLLPNGKKHGQEWRAGSVAGEPGQSLGVRISGAKTGTWKDFSGGGGAGPNSGDMLDLWSACRGVTLADARREAAGWLGLPDGGAPIDSAEQQRRRAELQRRLQEKQAAEEADRQRKAEYARDIWRQCQPITDTPAESYLRERAITGAIPQTLRFHPGLKHSETGLFFPAMVGCISHWPERTVRGIHRTFLTHGRDGWTKAQVTSPKKALGDVLGGSVRLAAAEPVTAICEGLETGLSIQQQTALPVWCALGTEGLKALKLPDIVTDVRIYSDHDRATKPDGNTWNPGREAAEATAERWLAEGRSVEILMPDKPRTDFNDLLLQGAF